jgi:hypothetical protein
VRKTVTLLIGVGLLAIAWRILSERGAAPVAPASGAPPPVEVPASRPAFVETPVDPSTRAVERVAFTDSKPADPSTTPSAAASVVRGRCVDAATRAPLAGCSVQLHGAPGSPERLDEYVARHGKVVWENPPPQTTNEDGRFEFRFTPPPPHQFFLFVTAPGRADMTARWTELADAAHEDLGDVALQRGTRLQGRVVDSAGAPQADVDLHLNLDFSRANPSPRGSHQLRTRADGTFGDERRLPSGRYRVAVPKGLRSIEPDGFTLGADEVDRNLDFKAVLVVAEEAIAGEVVDDSGAPVARASINYLPWSGGSRWNVETRKDGTFTLQRTEKDAQEPVKISAHRDGFDSAETATRIAWGSKDVKLVLKRGLTVEIVVRNGDDGTALEEYGVRCFTSPETTKRRSSKDSRLRESGSHPGGVLQLQGIVRGTHWLIVEPTGVDWMPSQVHSFEVTDAGAPRQDITVHRPVKRTVHVKRSNGAPVVGTDVDVVRRGKRDQAIDETAYAQSEVGLWLGGNNSALLVSKGETDEAGNVEIKGPRGETAVLRVLGPGHVPWIGDVVFDDSGVFEVVVASGSTFSGRIGPPEILAQLHPRGDALAEVAAKPPPGVSLRQKSPRFREFPADRRNPPLGPDGAFRLEGAPPGPWEVHLHYSQVLRNAGGYSTMGSSYLIGRVDLVDGAERKEDYDLSHLLQATVDGAVTLDGKPMEEGSIGFFGVASGPLGDQRLSLQGIPLGAGGRFNAALTPGEHRVVVQFPKGDRFGALVGADAFRVRPGEKSERNFALRSSTLKFLVVGSDGKTPAAGVQLSLDVPEWPVWSNPTSALGTAEVEGLQAGTVEILVRPRALASAEAQAALYHEGKNPADAMVRVATVTVTPPETVARIVLPASTGY